MNIKNHVGPTPSTLLQAASTPPREESGFLERILQTLRLVWARPKPKRFPIPYLLFMNNNTQGRILYQFLCKTFSKLVVNAFVLIYSLEIGTFCVRKQSILAVFQSEHEILIEQQQQQSILNGQFMPGLGNIMPLVLIFKKSLNRVNQRREAIKTRTLSQPVHRRFYFQYNFLKKQQQQQQKLTVLSTITPTAGAERVNITENNKNISPMLTVLSPSCMWNERISYYYQASFNSKNASAVCIQ